MVVTVDEPGGHEPTGQVNALALWRRRTRWPDVPDDAVLDDDVDRFVGRSAIFSDQCETPHQRLAQVFNLIFAAGTQPYSAMATARPDTSNARRASSPRHRRARRRTSKAGRHNPGFDPSPSTE